jgi:TRAP-type mannitol/chloroaromatic compound transport system permease small subunit
MARLEAKTLILPSLMRQPGADCHGRRVGLRFGAGWPPEPAPGAHRVAIVTAADAPQTRPRPGHRCGGNLVSSLLSVSRLIDRLSERIGHAFYWLVLAAVLISAANAVVRKAFNFSSNAFLEIQWYLFSAIFLFLAGYTLLRNDHVRIDVISHRLSKRAQTWIDIIGTVFFLFPMAFLLMWLSWPVFVDAYQRNEISTNAGGLIIWPARLLVPVGFFLLILQGISELIKRIGFLRGLIPDPTEKPHEKSLEEQLAEEIVRSRGDQEIAEETVKLRGDKP